MGRPKSKNPKGVKVQFRVVQEVGDALEKRTTSEFDTINKVACDLVEQALGFSPTAEERAEQKQQGYEWKGNAFYQGGKPGKKGGKRRTLKKVRSARAAKR